MVDILKQLYTYYIYILSWFLYEIHMLFLFWNFSRDFLDTTVGMMLVPLIQSDSAIYYLFMIPMWWQEVVHLWGKTSTCQTVHVIRTSETGV